MSRKPKRFLKIKTMCIIWNKLNTLIPDYRLPDPPFPNPGSDENELKIYLLNGIRYRFKSNKAFDCFWKYSLISRNCFMNTYSKYVKCIVCNHMSTLILEHQIPRTLLQPLPHGARDGWGGIIFETVWESWLILNFI